MDQQFSLSWNNFHGNLSKGFAGLLGKGEFVDVTIAVDGHLLQAHKVILSICSPYFKKMFQTNPCQHPIVVLRDVTHKAMRDLLQFMYHGEVSVKQEDLTSFIGTAEVLQIKGLTTKESDDEEPSENRSQISKESNTKTLNNIDTDLDDELQIAEESQTKELDLSKSSQFIDNIQKLNNLKRKSEDYLQKTYYATDIFDKRPKFKEKLMTKHNSTHQNNFNIYDETPVNITSTYNTARNDENVDTKHDDNHHDQMLSPDSNLQLKSECEDNDIIVTDPAVCNSPKSYEASRDNQKDCLNYSTAQDNCSSLSSLFLDLRNLVNGKMCHDGSRVVNQNDLPGDTKDHRLITIPQKEDGKKKYPQRSCRLCWRLGKRRDTRFMCSACELPFCKLPCFEIHYENVIKAARLHGEFYTT